MPDRLSVTSRKRTAFMMRIDQPLGGSRGLAVPNEANAGVVQWQNGGFPAACKGSIPFARSNIPDFMPAQRQESNHSYQQRVVGGGRSLASRKPRGL